MGAFSTELFLSTLGLIGAVIMVSALFSGALERSGVPQVLVFLGIGALIGPSGFGLLDAAPESPILRVVATLSLALVLFTDAVSLNLAEVRQNKRLSFLVVGPGTLFSAVLIAWIAWWLLGLAPAYAAILGAALASTDPVLLRSILRRPGLDANSRQALRLESGMNDAVLLPVVLVAMAALQSTSGLTMGEWGKLAVNMLVLSPGIGGLVALAAIGVLEFIRRRTGVRRDYESIYSLGVAFTAFAAAEAAHGSGFLAAFAAGLMISALDVELCDCFLEYGETTAEMALLFTFVLFGTSIIWTGVSAASGTTLLFAGLVFLARPLAFVPALLPSRASWRSRFLIAWFGPRGLSSLLLVLLPVFAGIGGSGNLLEICSLVVLCSVCLHGFSPMLFLRGAKEQPAPAVAASGASLANPEYITIDEMRALQDAGETVIVADARSERTYLDDPRDAAEAIRVHPDHAAADGRARGLPGEAVIAVFCA
jgi:NhaP-type Na+/H+ or K+/H+ antiporter